MFKDLKQLCKMIGDSTIDIAKEPRGIKNLAFIHKDTKIDMEKLNEIDFHIIVGEVIIENIDTISLTCGYRISKYSVVTIDKLN